MRTFLSKLTFRLGRSKTAKSRGERCRKLRIEDFEPRRLLTIWWDGGGGNSSWDNPLNWSGDHLPTEVDDVVIHDDWAHLTIGIGGDYSIRSLQSAATISLGWPSILHVEDTLFTTKPFTLWGGTLKGATILAESAELGLTEFGGVLDGVTLPGDLHLKARYSTVKLVNCTVPGSITLELDAGVNLIDTVVTGDLLLNGAKSVANVGGSTTFAAARLKNQVGFHIAAGYTLNSLISIEGPGSGERFIILDETEDSDTVTFGPSSVLQVSAAGLNILQQSGSSMHLINQGLIKYESGSGYMSIDQFSNEGLLHVQSGSIKLLPNDLTNSGEIKVTDGARLDISHGWDDKAITIQNWRNTGSFVVDAATLVLGGTFATADLGNLNRNGGTIHLSGVLNNQDSQLHLNQSTGSWNLRGGDIQGGTIQFSDGQNLIATGSGGRLVNVTVQSNLVIPPSSSTVFLILEDSTIHGELILNATYGQVKLVGASTFLAARLIGGGAQLQLPEGYELNSPVTAEGSASNASFGGRKITLYPSDGSGKVTFGPSADILLLEGTNGDLNIEAAPNVSLLNRSLISAEAFGRWIDIRGNVINEGQLRAVGGSRLSMGSGDIFVSEEHSLQIGPGSLVSVNGNLTGDVLSASLFEPRGLVQFRGGPEDTPRLLEVMSHDLGNVVEGFAGDFAYGALNFSPHSPSGENGSFVRLINETDNVPEEDVEVLYVGDVYIWPGVTLDLNGQTMYARSVQGGGTVIGGSVEILGDGGALLMGVQTPGRINVAEEVDEWTFSAHTGHRISIHVNLGAWVDFMLSPHDPRLSSPRITLMDSEGQTLITRTGSDSVSIKDFKIPKNGDYRIQIRSTFPDATGNYNILIVGQNTDLTSPTSSLVQLPEKVRSPFIVQWTGSDNEDGSGIAYYDVFVSENGEPFRLWKSQSTESSAEFTGDVEKEYGFYSVAVDFAGNREAKNPVAETSSKVVAGSLWQNPTEEHDVNSDRRISAVDALQVINYLNSNQPRNLVGSGYSPPPYVDVSGDERVSALDALLVINRLNERSSGGEGESILHVRHSLFARSLPPVSADLFFAEYSHEVEDKLGGTKSHSKPGLRSPNRRF